MDLVVCILFRNCYVHFGVKMEHLSPLQKWQVENSPKDLVVTCFIRRDRTWQPCIPLIVLGCPKPLFQSEAKCEPIDNKMILIQILIFTKQFALMMLVYINRVVGVRDPQMMKTAGYIESSGSLTTWCIWLSSNPLFWLLQVTAKLNLLFEIFISFKIFLPVRGYYYSRCTVVYSVTGPQRVVFLLLLHYLQIKKRLFQINC